MSGERVLFVTRPLEWGGAEKHLTDLIVRADPARLDPAILAFAPDLYAKVLSTMGRSDVPVREATAATFRQYRRIFADARPAVIVFVNGMLGLFPSRAYAAARRSGARRVIGLEHSQAGAPPPQALPQGLLGPLRGLIGWRSRYMFDIRASGYLSHATVCVSNGVRRTLIDTYGYPAGSTLTVQNGIDTQYYRRSGGSRAASRAALGLEGDDEVLVYVARLTRLKRIDILLRAVAGIRGRRPALRCVVVGGGVLESELKAQSQALGLESTVLFAGQRDDVRPYLEAADLYATPSEREGLPLSLAEAMAYELPCVATNIGGHDEILSEPGTGILVEPGRPEDLAGAIENLLDNPAAARAMGVAARRVVEDKFSIERMVEQLVSIFLKR